MFCKFAKFSGKHLCQNIYFNNVTGHEVSSCEFCRIFKNIYFYTTSPAAVLLNYSIEHLQIDSFCTLSKNIFKFIDTNTTVTCKNLSNLSFIFSKPNSRVCDLFMANVYFYSLLHFN